MKIVRYPSPHQWPELLRRPALEAATLDTVISSILLEVKARGDKALVDFAARFDGARIEQLEVSEEEMRQAEAQVPAPLKAAMATAAYNIRQFHQAQATPELRMETSPGVTCWRKAVAIERVGIYIPGGSAPLFSTVLMLAIPAALAGCKEIVMCSPPGKDGLLHPAILYAARQSGVTRIFKAGGAQAIAAMAYGTESVPAVYKIFGPGNQYVTAAKQRVSTEGVAIDMPAGPSEVAVLADASANPAFVAADLLSQAEHGPDSQVLLVTTDEGLLQATQAELDRQLALLPRKEIAKLALENSRVILVNSLEEGMELLNAYAAEHLIIATEKAEEWAAKVTNAGSVFVGHYTPESAGDYASGTNHTLPTNGFARAYSGVSLGSFVKHITFQQITPKGLQGLGPSIEIMAAAEALEAHKNAITLRLNALKTEQTS
jgi:histidinol dehydrogenase